jgi:hypothetical protein
MPPAKVNLVVDVVEQSNKIHVLKSPFISWPLNKPIKLIKKPILPTTEVA